MIDIDAMYHRLNMNMVNDEELLVSPEEMKILMTRSENAHERWGPPTYACRELVLVDDEDTAEVEHG